MSKRMNWAMGLAAEYRALSARGDVVLAEQAARTIGELVGRYTWRDGAYILTLPAQVRAVMASRG